MAATSVVDDRAFERLYRRYARDVYRFALALVRNPSDAEDVTQTTFMNAYRALQAGEEPRRPQNWLLTIAHNTARSRGRRAVRRPREVPLEAVVGQLAVPEHAQTNVRELLRALRRLPSNQRSAITMREFEGRSYPEIAESLGVSVPAVEALLARARRTLRLHAAAIRGIAVAGLPRSVRRLLENGEATTGSALGAGLIAKAAAIVLAAGAVAGGIGFSTGQASRSAAPSASAGIWPHDQGAVLAAAPRRETTAAAAVGVAPPRDGALKASHRIGRLPRPDGDTPASATRAGDPTAHTGSPAAASAATEPKPVHAAVQAVGEPVRSAVDVVHQAVQTVSTAIPAVPAPPAVPPPPVPAPPPVTLPPVPDPPAVPALPVPPPPPPLP
jgi:RNA polymerase sigma factor (sigma-70 family)